VCTKSVTNVVAVCPAFGSDVGAPPATLLEADDGDDVVGAGARVDHCDCGVPSIVTSDDDGADELEERSEPESPLLHPLNATITLSGTRVRKGR